MFTKLDYDKLHDLVFRSDYLGYKPKVIELPNGDGKADTAKRYAHIATKYFTTESQYNNLFPYLERGHQAAVDVAIAIDFPRPFWPKIEYSALRLLEYPPGAISNEHKDFDLFTLMLYRDQPDKFVNLGAEGTTLNKIRQINPQAHLGELGTEIGLGDATPHKVLASDTTQHSIVYFVLPDHLSVLPSGALVKDFLNERMKRSRTSFVEY